MSEIKIERQPNADRLSSLGVRDWDIWSKEVSEFPWTYDAAETCYFLQGEVEVVPDGGVPVENGRGRSGDLSQRHVLSLEDYETGAQALQLRRVAGCCVVFEYESAACS